MLFLLQDTQLEGSNLIYLGIFVGYVLANVLIPVLRQHFHCLEQTTCFSLAFGVCAALMLLAIALFILGKSSFIPTPNEDNTLALSCKCIGYAVVRKIQTRRQTKKDHWLDYADDKYDTQLIQDIKNTFRILLLLLPMPVYSTLIFQLGSSFLFQATKMNGNIGFMTILPDQIQFFNSVMILAAVPVLDKLCSSMARLKDMHKLEIAGLLNALAFVIAAFLQRGIDRTASKLATHGEAQVRVYNTCPCEINIKGLSGQGDAVSSLSSAYFGNVPHLNTTYKIHFKQACEHTVKYDNSYELEVTPNAVIGIWINFRIVPIHLKNYLVLFMAHFKEDTNKSIDTYPRVR